MGSRGPARRRIYSPTAPVFAREDLKFSGRPVATRTQVPEEFFRSARDRRVMWDARKIDHAADLPVKREAPPMPPMAAEPVAAAVVESEAKPEIDMTAARDAARYTAARYPSTAPAAPASLPEATAQAAEGGAVSPAAEQAFEQMAETLQTLALPGVATTDLAAKIEQRETAARSQPAPAANRPSRSKR